MRSAVLVAAIMSLTVLGSSPAMSQGVPGCGSMQNAFGPYDYRDPTARRGPLRLVEDYHFTRNVEALTSGASGTLIGDIDYTLRAFPNHYRALGSVARYALQGGRFSSTTIQSADCFFERAIAFRPDDEVVRVLYANYLAKRESKEAAREQYEVALRLAPLSPEINYNAGLFFLDVGDLDRARQLAQIAYDKGHPLPGLREKLEAAESNRSKQ